MSEAFKPIQRASAKLYLRENYVDDSVNSHLGYTLVQALEMDGTPVWNGNKYDK